MGTILEAFCECGYSSGEIWQGGGMPTFTTRDMEPAFCEKCSKVIVLNYMKEDPRCPSPCKGKPTFYNDPSLQKIPDDRKPERSTIQWGEFFLPDVDYLCPRCHEMKMRFHEMGCWD